MLYTIRREEKANELEEDEHISVEDVIGSSDSTIFPNFRKKIRFAIEIAKKKMKMKKMKVCPLLLLKFNIFPLVLKEIEL